jgi:hypothetical protein
VPVSCPEPSPYPEPRQGVSGAAAHSEMNSATTFDRASGTKPGSSTADELLITCTSAGVSRQLKAPSVNRRGRRQDPHSARTCPADAKAPAGAVGDPLCPAVALQVPSNFWKQAAIAADPGLCDHAAD